MRSPPIRAVVDTNVIFEGLTKRDTAAGWIVEAALAGLFQPCISNALAYEYADVLSRKLSSERWEQVRPLLRGFLDRAEPVVVYFAWRPSSPDPADEHVIDCAMSAAAVIVTENLRDFRRARSRLGIPVSTPVEFLQSLRSSLTSNQ